ncbi:MAG: SurA N-terminal domain-containing protein, partial [Gammaproteobacteria bacterium]|nr:SurA N-terminal domain-containing protein [Gammaproteobacteria bacterium]
MLQAIRDKTSGWIAYLIVFLISIPFALWGVNSYLGGGEATPAAIVNGEEISAQNLDTAYSNYRRRLAEVFGGTIPAGLGDETIMKDQVLSQLIEEYALRSHSDQKRYRIGNQQLNEIIRSMEVFQVDGKFDPHTYQSQVRSLGYSTAGFEQELRQSQAMQQLQSGIVATAFTPPYSGRKLASLTNQKRHIRVITRKIETENLAIDESEIVDHFESNSVSYMTDEQVKIDYIEISLEALKSSIEVGEEQLRSRYEQTKEAYSSAEKRTAGHILLTVPGDATQGQSDEVKNKLLEIKSQIDSGADFADLARQNSEDTMSGSEGGDLGQIERGMMVQPFETVLFGMVVGEVSDPVKTSFGWHLIKLHEVSGAGIKTFEEVRDELADELKTELAEGQIYDLTENLANIAYEQPDSLEPAAEQLDLELQTSGWFSRHSGEGIAAEALIRSSAYSNEVLTQGINSEAVELGDSRIVFIHLSEHKPAAARPLEEVRDEIVVTLKKRKAREETLEQGKQALESITAGKSLDDMAAQWQVDILDPGLIGRDSDQIAGDLVKLAFTMKKPQGSPVYEGFSHANGNYSLIELIAVES